MPNEPAYRHRAPCTLVRCPCVECCRLHSVVDIPYIAELNASAQSNFGRPQTALMSTPNGTLHNTIRPKLIWDCPTDGDANDPLFKALVEPVVHPNCSECAPHIPLTAFEQATKPMMDAPTKILPILVLLYVFWTTLHEPIPLLTRWQEPLYWILKSKPPVRAQRLVCTQLPSEID